METIFCRGTVEQFDDVDLLFDNMAAAAAGSVADFSAGGALPRWFEPTPGSDAT